MGLEEIFKGKIVYLDSSPLIYYLEKNQRYFEQVARIFESFDAGDFIFITSTITLAEVFTFPHQEKKIQESYNYFFSESSPIIILPVGIEEAKAAADIRRVYKLKTPDAIHLATASEYHADFFFTNDSDFTKIFHLPIVTLQNK